MAVKAVASLADLKRAVAIPTLSVVDFFANWCGPCKMIAPQVHELAMQHPNVNFMKVDVDHVGDAAAEFRVRAMPTFIFFRGGAEMERFEGADIRRLAEGIARLNVAPRPSIPVDAELESMPVRQLLALLGQLNVSTSGCIEKSELVALARRQR